MSYAFSKPQQATDTVACLHFDGLMLNLLDRITNQQGISLGAFPAISGQHGFQSPALAKHQKLGPIPDGRYSADIVKGFESKGDESKNWPEGVANTRLRLVREANPEIPRQLSKSKNLKPKVGKVAGDHFLYLGLDGFAPGVAGSVVVLPSGRLTLEKLFEPIKTSGEQKLNVIVQNNRALCFANHPYFDASTVRDAALATAKYLTIPKRHWHQGTQLLKGDQLPKVEAPNDVPIPTSLHVGGDLANPGRYQELSEYTLGSIEPIVNPLSAPILRLSMGTILNFNDAGEPDVSNSERAIDYMANVEGQDRAYLDLFGMHVEPAAQILAEDEHGIEDYDAVWNILKHDKAVIFSNGEKRRASTGELVGSLGDRMIWAVTGHKDKKTGAISVADIGQIRLGSKLSTSKEAYWSPQMLVEGREHLLTPEGLFRNPDGSNSPAHWISGGPVSQKFRRIAR